jgi:omega-amidase
VINDPSILGSPFPPFSFRHFPALMQLVLCQWDVIWRQPDANFQRVRALLDRVDAQPGALVLLPEMFATGFAVREPEVPTESAHASGRFLRELAIERRSYVLGGLAQPIHGGRAVNVARLVAPDGSLIAEYEKLHPFRYGDEHRLYDPGQATVRFSWQGYWAAPLICYDLRFPEVFRASAQAGVVLFLILANWPTARVDHWITLLRARAIENQAFVVGVNRTGQDPHVSYPGRSLVIDPLGNVVIDAGDADTALPVEIDLAVATRWRTEFPALRDARPDAFQGALPDHPAATHVEEMEHREVEG